MPERDWIRRGSLSNADDASKSRAEYQNLLTLWKDADLDIPIFISAKAEYGKLK